MTLVNRQGLVNHVKLVRYPRQVKMVKGRGTMSPGDLVSRVRMVNEVKGSLTRFTRFTPSPHPATINRFTRFSPPVLYLACVQGLTKESPLSFA